jgi:hypothetical protein
MERTPATIFFAQIRTRRDPFVRYMIGPRDGLLSRRPQVRRFPYVSQTGEKLRALG